MKIKDFVVNVNCLTIEKVPTSGVFQYNKMICIRQENAMKTYQYDVKRGLPGLKEVYECINLNTGEYVEIPSGSSVVYYPNAELDLKEGIDS